MPTLYQLGGSSVMRVVPLPRGVFTIGRGTGNDLALADAEVSREHCRLTTSAGRTLLEDRQSRNGTWILETGVETPTPLRDGDRIRIGQTVFVFREDRCPSTTMSSPCAPPVPPIERRRREEFRFKIRWQFDWSGFGFGWRIRRA